jgi:hypothetical protein
MEKPRERQCACCKLQEMPTAKPHGILLSRMLVPGWLHEWAVTTRDLIATLLRA